jgi:cytidylate kinase
MVPALDRFVDHQFRRWDLERKLAREKGAPEEPFVAHPVITVSRQHGAGGALLAAALAERFGYTLLHRNLIDRLCESNDYSRRLVERLDEHAQSELDTWVEAMVAGRYVDAGDYARALFRTLYSIARLGGVVVVGRGANFVVGLDHGFHVRLVAPRDVRIGEIARRTGKDAKDAAREVDEVDRDRAAFVRRLFDRSVDDPLGYDVIVNAGAEPSSVPVGWLVEAARGKFTRLHPLPSRMG